MKCNVMIGNVLVRRRCKKSNKISPGLACQDTIHFQAPFKVNSKYQGGRWRKNPQNLGIFLHLTFYCVSNVFHNFATFTIKSKTFCQIIENVLLALMCLFVWIFRASDLAQEWLHCLQVKGFSPVWVNLCVFRELAREHL